MELKQLTTIDLQQLIDFDKELLLQMNGSGSSFWDAFMLVATSVWIWIPLYLSLLYVVVKNRSAREVFYVVLAAGVVVLLADQFSSGFCKPYFQRWRPTRDPEIMYLVDTVNGYRGGRYGFISSHAANTFGIAMFFVLLFRRWSVSLLLIAWAMLNCYTRIYLGVHFPGDILCGTVWGCFSGILTYNIFKRYVNCTRIPTNNTGKYTSTGFAVVDFNAIMLVMASTLTLIIMLSFVYIPLYEL
ncbi:MAG: phosphatase PAP2 family protein [Bacteroidales bacterium]|nr:phosphatase PAP2 family protein [Bacteroidales bacterium]